MPKKVYKTKKRVYRKKRKNIKRKLKRYRNIKANPGWNPQYFKLKRMFQYSAPLNDVPGVITSGIQIEDPYVLSADSNITKSTTYDFKGFTFTASQVPDISSYANLFDQYLISYIKLKFEYMSSTNSKTEYAVVNMPRCKVLCWTDFDDIATPGTNLAGWEKTYETGRAKQYCFPNNGKNSFSIGFRPRILVPAVDGAGGITARLSSGPRWQDGSTALDTIHYGVKLLMQANPSYDPIYHFFRVTATFYFKFKQRKTV